MTIDKFPVDHEPTTVDTRWTRKRVAKAIGATIALTAVATGVGATRGLMNQMAHNQSSVKQLHRLDVVTPQELGVTTVDGIIEAECPEFNDAQVLEARSRLGDANPDLVNGYLQVSPTDPVTIPTDLCVPQK